MATTEQLRELALACPDVEEGAHHGKADFRCAGRVFATIHPGGEVAMVKLPPGLQEQLLLSHAAFRPASGAWGRAGCTLVTLSQVTRRQVADAVQAAWEFAVAMSAQRRSKK